MVAHPSCNPPSLHPTGYIRTSAINAQIRSIVLDISARYRALRILGIGRGAQPLCHDLHYAGYSVAGIESGEDNTLCHTLLGTSTKHHDQRWIDLGPLQDAPFDMAISIELGEPSSMPSILIELAAMKLQRDGVFILSIPHRSNLKNLLTMMRDWLKFPFSMPRERGYGQRWSKQCLINLLEIYGFTMVEIIGVRGASLQWESLILVARKTEL